MSTVNVSVRMDAEIKNQADAMFKELGMTTAGAINIFVRQALRTGGLPFTPQLNTAQTPNQETVAAMLEAKRLAKDPTAKRYRTAGELFAELDASLDQ